MVIFVAFLGVIVSTFAAIGETRNFSTTADNISFTYSGANGGIRLSASSDSYSYQFGMDAESFAGSFTGNASGFSHSASFKNAIGASLIETNGAVVATSFSSLEGWLAQILDCNGDLLPLTLAVTIFGEETDLSVIEPLPPPPPPIEISYIYNDQHRIIGGRIKNTTRSDIQGVVGFLAGLGYERGWMSSWQTHFLEGGSPQITISGNQTFEFYIISNPQGGYTFVFPDIIIGSLPMTFSVFPPSANSNWVASFKQDVYEWYTGYKDPEPGADYIHLRLNFSYTTKGQRQGQQTSKDFWMPFTPYFPPAR